MATPTGSWHEFAPSRYEVNFSWLVVYFAATAALASCAMAAVVLSTMIHAPDLFGGVSGLTRDSAFITSAPPGGSTLSGTERARLLRDIWVRIRDVKPDEEVGRMAFSDEQES